MPTEADMDQMHSAGYGLGVRTLRKYGGLRKLQEDLGFCPDGLDLSKDELLERFSWLANHAYVSQYGEDGLAEITVDELIRWGAARDLIPGRTRTRRILEGDTLTLRKRLGIERKVTAGAVSNLDIFRFGQTVIVENGGPIGSSELSSNYQDAFVSDAYELIRWRFGTLSNFWLQFDRVTSSSGLAKKEILEMGIRWFIRNGETTFTPNLVAQLSREKLFVSKTPIVKYFGTIPNYRKEVEAAFAEYKQLAVELMSDGVSSEVVRAACLRFENTDEFKSCLRNNTDVLSKLSQIDATYIVKIIEKGFDLSDEPTFEMQFRDVTRLLKKAGITRKQDLKFVFSLIPRLDEGEALKLLSGS